MSFNNTIDSKLAETKIDFRDKPNPINRKSVLITVSGIALGILLGINDKRNYCKFFVTISCFYGALSIYPTRLQEKMYDLVSKVRKYLDQYMTNQELSGRLAILEKNRDSSENDLHTTIKELSEKVVSLEKKIAVLNTATVLRMQELQNKNGEQDELIKKLQEDVIGIKG